MAKKIVEFYGQECPYCIAIDSAVEKLEQEEDVEFESLEVWHNEENRRKMASLRKLYDQNCNGNFVVPSFYDPQTNRLIGNPGSYENLKQWIFSTGD